ncbi:MAG: glycosyltransferase family 4 protein [Candidatus Aminicenantia bacterium]
MKIAIDVRKIDDFGIGTHIFNLLRAISLIDREDEYFLIGYRRGSLPQLGENFKFLKAFSAKYSISEQIELPIILRKIKTDIFHSPHYVIPLFYRGLITVTIHDVIHLIFPSYFQFPGYRTISYFLMKNAVKKSRIVFTVSETSKRDIIRLFPFAEKKVEVVYNGLDERFFEKARTDLVQKFKKKYGKFILYVGNTKPHKNIGVVVRAMKMARERMSLVIVGGNPKKNLLSLIKKEGLKERVFFKGLIPFEELSALYESAEVFVFPSFYEGFGLPPLEAMAKGTPVVSSLSSSLPEILKDGAIYFDPNSEESLVDAINSLFEKSALRESLLSKGKKIAEGYRWKDSAEKFINFWRNIK